MTDRVPAPAWLAEHARRFTSSGATAATPRLAATVILARDAADGFEVYAQRRAATMAFAPNMYAFPGGVVDPRDADVDLAWVGPDPTEWAAVLGLTEADARAVVCAAVREVFEECGVLLAGPVEASADSAGVVGDVSSADWEAARVALVDRTLPLAVLLATHGLAVRSDLLVPWTRWLTPDFEPRRYDTYFFVARLPGDQRTRDVGGEADHSLWLRPADAARLPMLPPTAHTLLQLAGYEGIEAVLAAGAGRDLSAPVTPRIHEDGEGAWLLLS
jgi:8-oxo-dGTP pyrophosphatase MutT (NUDIX family)